MAIPSSWRRVFRFPFGRHQLERDLDDELRFHLEQRAEHLVEEGFDPESAQHEARRRFGDLHRVRHQCLELDLRKEHRMRLATLADELRLDARYALRSLARQPLLTAIAVFTLALGLGATTTVFSLLDAVVLQPPPWPDPHRVVLINPVADGEPMNASPGLAFAWSNASEIEALGMLYAVRRTLTVGDQPPHRVEGYAVSAGYFSAFGLAAAHGRLFGEIEDQPGAAPVVVLGHRLWQRRFAADPETIGRTIVLDDVAHTVVGVLPPELDLTVASPQIWVPLALPESQRDYFGGNYLGIVARLASGLSPSEAANGLRRVIERLDLRTDSGESLGVSVQRADAALLGEESNRLWLLFGAVLAVLLITCGNVTNLLLARCAARGRELGVRSALGAGNGRIVRQLLTESLALAVLGVAGGILLVRWGTTLLATALSEVPRAANAGIDARVLTFALALTIMTSLVFGLAPALRIARLDIRGALSADGPRSGLGGGRGGRDRLRGIFVAAQVALSLPLLTGAALLLESGIRLGRVDTGITARNVLTAELQLPELRYPDLPSATGLYRDLLDRATAIPGVDSAALVSRAPLAGSNIGLDFALEGQVLDEPGIGVQSRIRIASPGFFETLGIALLAGRPLESEDRSDRERAVVVNRALARRLLANTPGPGEDRQDEEHAVIGRRIQSDGYSFKDAQGRPFLWRVVGLVEDVRDDGLRAAPEPTVYLSLEQSPTAPWTWMGRSLILAIRAQVEPTALTSTLRNAVRDVDPQLPLADVATLEQRFAASVARERLNTSLLSALGLVALALAAAGIYGVVSYFVNQRRHELGLRLALGATAADLRRLVVSQGLQPVWGGLLVGAGLSFATARALESQLYGIASHDIRPLFAAALLLAVIALLACSRPAERAAQADPAEILRGS